MTHNSTESIGFFCSSPSWGGLELNVLRLAGWLSDRGMPVTILAPGGTPLNRRASVEGRAVSVVGTHRRYFDLGAARRLRARLEELGITTVLAKPFRRQHLIDLIADITAEG